jgi:hypothetical protein
MKLLGFWTVTILLTVGNLNAQEVKPAPAKFKSPEECFAALQKATASDPPDYAAVLACQSPAMSNVQAGQIAFHLTRGALFGVLPKKDVDSFLIKHDLADLDLFEVLQIASGTNGGGELKGFNMIGGRIVDKPAFLKGSAAWMKKYAEADKRPTDPKKPAADEPKPKLKLAKVETMGDTAMAVIVDEQGKELGKACFRLIAGSWVSGFPGKEPKLSPFTKEQREAIEKLNEKGNVRIGDEEDNYALEYSFSDIEQAGDDDLMLLKTLPTFKAIYLDGTQVTDAGLRHLDTQTALEALDLAGTKVTEAGILSLTRHKHLKSLALNNLDVSPAALKKLKDALPTCEISHGWNLQWVIVGPGDVDIFLQQGPVLITTLDEASERRVDDWRNKLRTRDAVLLERELKFQALTIFTEPLPGVRRVTSLEKIPGLDAKKTPQFVLLTKPGAKPIELSEKASGAELLAEIRKALRQ